MALYDPDKTRFNLPRDGFLVDADNLEFVIQGMPTAKILWLPPEIAELVAPSMSCSPNSIYFAASGVPVGNNYCGQFRKEDLILAVEHVRFEPNPNISKCEPNFNLNRYIFGVSASNDKAYGIDVTTWLSDDRTGQVGNHWDKINNYIKQHFSGGHS